VTLPRRYIRCYGEEERGGGEEGGETMSQFPFGRGEKGTSTRYALSSPLWEERKGKGREKRDGSIISIPAAAREKKSHPCSSTFTVLTAKSPGKGEGMRGEKKGERRLPISRTSKGGGRKKNLKLFFVAATQGGRGEREEKKEEKKHVV